MKLLKLKPSVGLLSIPYSLIFIFFFFIPLSLTFIISFWDYNEYSIIPDFIFEKLLLYFQRLFQLMKKICVLLLKHIYQLLFFVLLLGSSR